MSPDEERALVTRAERGERAAFDVLVKDALPKLRAVLRRLVGSPDDTDDLAQETLLKGFEKLSTFRGEARFSSWLTSIGTRLALNHLREKRQWRWDAQVHIAKLLHSTAEGREALQAIFRSPGHRFDAREHIAFCFSCVSRSLPPAQHAALILRDVFDYKNREAAKALGLRESELRRDLGEARATMQQRFDGLCGLVSKDGICYQCKGLREQTPDKCSAEIPELGAESAEARYTRRLEVSRDADLDHGAMQDFHDMVWRDLARLEETAR
ncbi:MAG: sigma-70 family RNA polymerase sigma factor [Myxococcales bacterium]|nr:sigma-70 family RNA polymerase sigma factor [Myxococcales bacterium]